MRFSFRILVCGLAAAAAAFCMLGCGGNTASPDILPHLSVAQTKHAVAIDRFEKFELPKADGTSDAAYRERVELLYNTVVYDGKQPVFQADDPVLPIYSAAHDFLETYIHDDWNEAEREVNTVHAIHDWLIYSTDYDFDLYQSYLSGGTEYASHPAFYIDGVLLGKKAVCDGLARTFNFLCAMEGIRSMRVTGSFSSGLHAWNKVNIKGEWYNVDVTADAVHYSVGSSNYKQIAHGFMLVCDKTLSDFEPNGHEFVGTSFTAQSDYDYFSNSIVQIGSRTFPAVVKTQAELNAIFSSVYALDGKVGKLELKLDFANKTQVNSTDMYRAEIAEAYSKVKNVGFDISSGSNPYFRFPNGVYLFLIYK